MGSKLSYSLDLQRKEAVLRNIISGYLRLLEKTELVIWLHSSSAGLDASRQENRQKSCIVGAPKWVFSEVHTAESLASSTSISSCFQTQGESWTCMCFLAYISHCHITTTELIFNIIFQVITDHSFSSKYLKVRFLSYVL